MIDWKNDKRVHFAIGLAVLVVGIKWLFTGTPFFAFQDMQQEPAEGQTATSVTTSALMPVFMDLLVGIVIAIGAWSLNIAGMVIGLFNKPAPPPIPTNMPSPAKTDVDKQREDVLNLARAAASNDLATLEELRIRIRRPRAIAELNAAYERGDDQAALKLIAELESLSKKKA